MADLLSQINDAFGAFVKEKLPDFFGKIIVAIIILLVGFIIGNLLGKLSKKILREFELNKIVRSATKMKIDVEGCVSRLTSNLIYFLTIIMALNQLGLTTVVLYMIAAAVIVIMVTWLLAIKDFLPNVFAGLYISRSNFIKVGDKVRFKNMTGQVMSISLLETRLKNNDGDIVSIPNSKLTKDEIVKIKQ